MAKQLGLTVYKPDKAYHGYTLFAPMAQTSIYLVDMKGSVVHSWQMPYRPGDYAYLLENGNLLCGGQTDKGPVNFGGRGGIIMEADWEGNILWEYVEDTLHHDFCRMENGNTMVLCWEPVPPDVSRRIKGGRKGTDPNAVTWSDFFREVTPDGQVAWEWHAYEHLDPELDIMCSLHTRDEWTHCNTCEVLPDGNVLTSFRLLDTVAIIDKQSGRFVWKWGRDELGHQHDPTLLDNGNILIFDNGWHSIQAPSPRSRVIEVDPKNDEIQWSFQTQPPWDFFSSFISGAQRLPGGNTLICEGMTGRVFEVTMDGDIVWEYTSPFFGNNERYGRTNFIFRAYRYGPDFPGFKGKHLDLQTHAWLSHAYSV